MTGEVVELPTHKARQTAKGGQPTSTGLTASDIDQMTTVEVRKRLESALRDNDAELQRVLGHKPTFWRQYLKMIHDPSSPE